MALGRFAVAQEGGDELLEKLSMLEASQVCPRSVSRKTVVLRKCVKEGIGIQEVCPGRRACPGRDELLEKLSMLEASQVLLYYSQA